MMKNKKGFTIVELVIVIAVIAILAGVLIPTFSGVVAKANKSAAEQEARNAYTQYVANKAETGSYEANVCVNVDKYYVYIENGSVVDAVDTAPTVVTGKVTKDSKTYYAAAISSTDGLNIAAEGATNFPAKN